MKKGFTLIELAIVLVIIGLLIAGILAGQSLIRQAQFRKAISQLRTHKLSINSFVTKYGQLPGDFNRAKDFMPDCKEDTLHGFTCSGNGNGSIGDSNGGSSTDPINHVEEGVMIWRHLSLSGLMAGDYNINDVPTWNDADVPEFSFPDSSIYKIMFVPGSEYQGDIPAMNKNNVMYFAQLEGVDTSSCDSVAELDYKIDDGKYSTGNMRSYASDFAFDQCSDLGSSDGSYFKGVIGGIQFVIDPRL